MSILSVLRVWIVALFAASGTFAAVVAPPYRNTTVGLNTNNSSSNGNQPQNMTTALQPVQHDGNITDFDPYCLIPPFYESYSALGVCTSAQLCLWVDMFTHGTCDCNVSYVSYRSLFMLLF